jgi:monoterpene epsilon-lactone hydrolase
VVQGSKHLVHAVLEGVTFEAATVGGISGWWANPAKARKGSAIIHVHGGWFNWGTAQAFRNFSGHIASSAGADAFIPDYRLSPEHPFPAVVRNLEECYRGLVDKGTTKITLTGDSAGGNLALVLLSIASAQASEGGVAPAGAVVFSLITDLALRGESFERRAEADPYFINSQAAGRDRSEESAGLVSLRGFERTASDPRSRWRGRGAASRSLKKSSDVSS